MPTVSDLNSNQPNIQRNDIINAVNVSDNDSLSHLTQALNNLLGIVTKQVRINNTIVTYDHDSSITHINNNNDKPQPNTVSYANEMIEKKDLINSLGNDCICYADCTQFAKWKYYTCDCNSDCGCNYFSTLM